MSGVKNRHVRFDDNLSDNDNDQESSGNQPPPEQSPSNEHHSIFLLKFHPDESFGFELRGEEKRRGENRVDSVEAGSAACRAGLQPGDRLVKINDYRVDQLNITELFSLIECEANIDPIRLNLVVVRRPRSQQNPNKRNSTQQQQEEPTSDQLKDEIDQMERLAKKKRQKKSNETTPTNLVTKPIVSISTSMVVNDDIGDFVPATQLERSYIQPVNIQAPVETFPPLLPAPTLPCTSKSIPNTDDNTDDVIPVKSLEQIRLEQIEKMKFLAPARPNRRPNVPSRAILNAKCKEIQARLSDQGKYVTWQEVVYELLQRYDGCSHIGDLGLAACDHLDAINELLRVQRRIDTLIIACEARMPYVTLTDLEQIICSDYNYFINNVRNNNNNSKQANPNPIKITTFEELNVGPLIKNQLVRQIFNLPSDVVSAKQLKPISGSELCKHLINYLREKEMWSKRIKDSDFEPYLWSKMKVSSQWVLAYRFFNIGQLVGSLKNVQHIYAESLKGVRASFETEFNVMFTNEKKWVLKQLTDRLAVAKENRSVQSALRYLETDSIDVIENLLGVFFKLLNKAEYKCIDEFLTTLKESVYLRDCFQLAICIGKQDFDSCMRNIEENSQTCTDFLGQYQGLLTRVFFAYVNTCQSKKLTSRFIRGFFRNHLQEHGLKLTAISHKRLDSKNDDDDDSVISLDSSRPSSPSLDTSSNKHSDQQEEAAIDYNSSLVELIETRLEPNSSVSFEQLAKIEELVFNSSQQHKFMELLIRNRGLFEKRGISFQAGGKLDAVASKRIDDPFLSEHIAQLQNSLSINSSQISEENRRVTEKLISDYYGSEFKLSETLIPKNSRNDLFVAYEDALVLDSNPKSNFTVEEKRKRLFQEIDNCPLLSDLNEHVNWRVEYSPLFGPSLKTYLASNPPDANSSPPLNLLEIDLNRFVKLASNPQVELLKESIEKGDAVVACAQLVSLLAIKYQSISSAPHALIVNEMQSSLSVLLKSTSCEDEHGIEARVNQLYETYSRTRSDDFAEIGTTRLNVRFMQFVARFIESVPSFKMAAKILFQFVLDPVVQLTSNHEFKTQLFEYLVIRDIVMDPYAAKNNTNSKSLEAFVRLGQACVIEEWSTDTIRSIRDSLMSFRNQKPSLSQTRKDSQETSAVQNDEIQVEKSNKSIEKANIPVAIVKPMSESGEMAKNSEKQFDHVQSIRKKYGIGIELNEQSRTVTESLKGVISRSLETLSSELYNKEMHFVLELIQNSDDNTYPVETPPTLVFLIEPQRISLLNNELGFEAVNVNAICDVKASTKGKHSHGYIGRKGIGFKSVFTVTNRPQIHSNGYHIGFDLEKPSDGNGESSLGYILPYWVEMTHEKCQDLELMKREAAEALSNDSQMIGELETIIELPLKSHSEMQRHKSSLLTNNFNDIKPNLLLFLNRLRNLVIINTETNTRLVYKRIDIDRSLIELHMLRTTPNGSSRQHHKWLVARESLRVPDNLKPADDVDATDLCLAFPMIDDAASSRHQQRMDVFAYLPLRSFGFKFIIQADFVVPASRQDLNQDSPWNQWLVNHIPELFVNSRRLFAEKFEPIDALKTYLRFIPLEDEIIGLFHHIPRRIFELLRQEPLLPVVEPTSEREITWRRPFECVLVKDGSSVISEVLTPDLLHQHLSRYYLHPSILDTKDAHARSLLIKLGVHELALSDIFEILKSALLSADQTATAARLDVTTTAKWLVVLHHCFNAGSQYSMQQEETFIAQLKQLEFIPVIVHDRESNKRVERKVALAKQSVFFAPKSKKPADKFYSLVESDLCLVDLDTLLCLDELRNAQIVAALKSLGVRDATQPSDVIEHHIMREFEKTSANSSDTFVDYLVYVACYSQTLPIDFERLRSVVRLRTLASNVSPPSEVFTTPLYGNPLDIATKFRSYALDRCQFIDPVYMKRSKEITNKSGKLDDMWKRFWSNLGLAETLVPRVREFRVTAQDDWSLVVPQFAAYKNQFAPLSPGQAYLFQDFEFDLLEFYANLAENNQSHSIKSPLDQEFKDLYRFIDQNWNPSTSGSEKRLVGFKNVRVYQTTDEDSTLTTAKCVQKSLCESSFYRALKTRKWMLAECARYVVLSSGNKIDQVVELKAKMPAEIFTRDHPLVQQIYGLHAAYSVDVSGKSTLGIELGMKFDFSLNDFLDTFESWLDGSNGISCFTITQLQHIYNLLANSINYEKSDSSSRIRQLITSRSFIFLPSVFDTNNRVDFESRAFTGRFYSPAELFWHDPTGLFTKYSSTELVSMPLFLEPIYAPQNAKTDHIRQIFTNEFGVTVMPTIEDYMGLLEHVCALSDMDKSPFGDEEILQHVFALYETLTKLCIEFSQADSQEVNIVDTVRDEFNSLIKDKRVIPCYSGQKIKWESLNQSNVPCLADADLDLAEKFANEINVVVTNATSSSSDSSEMFLSMCRFDSSRLSHELAVFWLDLLQLSRFSSLVILDLENITESLMEAPADVQNRCRRLVPFVQSFLYSVPECRPIYDKLKSVDIKNRLDKLKIYSVQELQNIYRFKHDSKIFCKVSNRTCTDASINSSCWKLFIRADVLGNVKDLLRGYLRFFTRRDELALSEKLEKDLFTMCMLIQQLIDGSHRAITQLNNDDRREIEREYNVKLVLPMDEASWAIKDIQLPAKDLNQLEEGEIDANESEDYMGERNNQCRPRYQPREPNSGPSKRDKIMTLETISNQQMNLPQTFQQQQQQQQQHFNPHPHHPHHHDQRSQGNYYNYPHSNYNNNYPNYSHHNPQYNLTHPQTDRYIPYQNAPIASQRTIDSLDKSLSELATKTGNTAHATTLEVYRPPAPLVINNSSSSDQSDMTELELRPNLASTTLESLVKMSRDFSQLTSMDNYYLQIIGRWGEMWVNEALKMKYQRELASNEIRIEWMNETAESGLPFDFRISRIGHKPAPNETDFTASSSDCITDSNDIMAFIEVKSTRRDDQASFPISYRELMFAQKYANKYEVYRLYGAGASESGNDSQQPTRVKIVRNIARLLDTHEINLFIVI